MDLGFVADELASNRNTAIRLHPVAEQEVELPIVQGRWTAAQHLKHLALFDEAYVEAMTAAVTEYREGGALKNKTRGIGLISVVF